MTTTTNLDNHCPTCPAIAGEPCFDGCANAPTTSEMLHTLWEMRLKFPTETDAEFVERLTALQVPDATEKMRAARFAAYRKNGSN